MWISGGGRDGSAVRYRRLSASAVSKRCTASSVPDASADARSAYAAATAGCLRESAAGASRATVSAEIVALCSVSRRCPMPVALRAASSYDRRQAYRPGACDRRRSPMMPEKSGKYLATSGAVQADQIPPSCGKLLIQLKVFALHDPIGGVSSTFSPLPWLPSAPNPVNVLPPPGERRLCGSASSVP